jgi:hypothetical protein
MARAHARGDAAAVISAAAAKTDANLTVGVISKVKSQKSKENGQRVKVQGKVY